MSTGRAAALHGKQRIDAGKKLIEHVPERFGHCAVEKHRIHLPGKAHKAALDPAAVFQKAHGKKGAVLGVFGQNVIQRLAGRAAACKIQSAFFHSITSLAHYARSLGDVKRAVRIVCCEVRTMKSKLSPAILEKLAAYPAGSMQVLVQAGCFSCKRKLLERNYEIVDEFPLINTLAVRVPVKSLALLAGKGYIRYITNDARVSIDLDRAGESVGAKRLASLGYTGKDVGIAIIDTGVYPHADFDGRIAAFYDFVNGRTSPYDDQGHGTFCAGCALGSGQASGGQYAGIAPGARLIAIKALDENGGGRISDILRAMQWVSDHRNELGIRVASLSFGVEPGLVDPRYDSLALAAEALWRQGIVVVAAAGNSGPRMNSINSPGSAASIITVGAADDRKGDTIGVARFSSRGGADGKKPDIVAPGVDIVAPKADVDYREGTTTAHEYTTLSGTSFSTPVVAGCAALLLEKNPDWSPDRVKAALAAGARDLGLPAYEQGHGLANVEKSGRFALPA